MAIKVFVSSTFREFEREREVIFQALTVYLGIACERGEVITAPAGRLEDRLHNLIDEADVVVLLVGFSYGSETDGIGWTEREVRYAKDHGKKIFIYMKDKRILNTRLDVDQAKQKKLNDFITFLETDIASSIPRFRKNWELAALVVRDVLPEKIAKEHDERRDAYWASFD